MKTTKKALLALVCAVALVFGSVFATYAYLTDTTEAVTNTFTVGNINIDLKEHKYNLDTNGLTEDVVTSNENYKMVPGKVLPKDPYVTVKAGSEACWLFVEVEESSNLDGFIDYNVETGEGKWAALSEGSNVYYRTVAASEDDQVFNVLKEKQVTVKDTVTKDMMDNVGENKPELKFTAYAVQREGGDAVDTAAEAWAIAKPAQQQA